MSGQEIVVRQEPATASAGGSQYLTFTLAGEEYGVDILKVQEIRGWTPVTRIPNTPGYVQGVLNLRGTIVPIVDLRMRFNLEKADYSPTTVVIVLSIETDRSSRVVGLIVDSVSDVLNLSPGDVRPAAELGGIFSAESINGLATIGTHMVILLDVESLLGTAILPETDPISH
ncbi:MAG: chemotaxis protein CheW [Gammaproteobacteria bacterium]|nr:chemotaxis protein CheW [Gammaproteobacteria bacterium]